VVATPGALYRYWRQGQTGDRLALVLIGGTLPGVIAGSVIRVELLPGPRGFDLVVGAVLLPLGTWLALTRPTRPDESTGPVRVIPVPVLVLLAAAVGCAGGIYGIGGRLDPGAHPDRHRPIASTGRSRCPGLHVRDLGGGGHHLHDLVHPPARVRGPQLAHRGSAWPRRAGRRLYRARIQSRLPDTLIRRLVGILVIAIGARYLWSGLS
jgi:uncharacterized protein